MSMSGIEVTSDTKQKYDEMKLKKTHQLLVMSIVNIDKKESIVVNEELSKAKCTYEEFYEFLKGHPCDCFYVVHEFSVNETKSALILISWVPDTAKVKDKMVYASTKEALKSKFEGIKVHVQANDLSEVTEDLLKEKCKKA